MANQKRTNGKSWRVRVICLENLTEDQIRTYILADNRLAEKAGWDDSILAIELQHLVSVDLGFDVSISGFEVGEIDLILQEAAGKRKAGRTNRDQLRSSNYQARRHLVIG